MNASSNASACRQQLQSSKVAEAYSLLLSTAIDSSDVAAILSAMRGLASDPEAQSRAIEGLFKAIGENGVEPDLELHDIFVANAGLWTVKEAVANHAMAHNNVARNAVLLFEFMTHIPKPASAAERMVKPKVGLAYVRWPSASEIRDCVKGGTNFGELFKSMDPSCEKSLQVLVQEMMEAWPSDAVLQAAGRSIIASIEEKVILARARAEEKVALAQTSAAAARVDVAS